MAGKLAVMTGNSNFPPGGEGRIESREDGGMRKFSSMGEAFGTLFNSILNMNIQIMAEKWYLYLIVSCRLDLWYVNVLCEVFESWAWFCYI